MKYLKKFLVLMPMVLLLSMPFVPQKTQAFNLPIYTIDQACTTHSAGTVFTNMTVSGTFQTFSPTMETLDSVSAYLSAAPGTTVPVKAKIFHYAPSGAMENFTLSISTVTLTDTPSWKAFKMEKKPMPAGIYALMIQVATNDGGEFYWYAKDDGNCYPNGYAVIDSHPDHNKDFNFVIFGKNSNPGTVAPEEASGTNSDSSDAIDATESTDVTDATDATGNTSSSSSSTTAPKVTASSNKQSTDAKSFMASPAKQAEFNQAMKDALIADFKKDNPKGIFGIGGFVGDILTWVNIAIFFGIILFFVLGFVLLIKLKGPKKI